MKPRTKRRLGFLAGFTAYFVALWLLWGTVVVYPLKLFVVLLHEVSHGLAAVATGGSIDAIVVTADQGGLCRCGGGNAFLTLSAGYLGSLGWGALILWSAMRGGRWTRTTSVAIGGSVILLALLYLRSPFGLSFAILFGGALLLAGWRLPARANLVLLTALGLTSCLYAILDIKSDILDRPHLTSDAAMLAEITGVPTLLWGVLWIGIALGASWWLFRWAWRRA